MTSSLITRLNGLPFVQKMRPEWPAVLAVYFILSLLLDRLNGWNFGSFHALTAGFILAWMMLREQPKSIFWFLLLLFSTVAWMCFRDVSTGAGWKASERSIKAAILLLGMLACCRLSSAHWKKTLTAIVPASLLIMIAFIGFEQTLQAVATPFSLASAGGLATPMNRNGLALPLGLVCCWAIAASIQLRPRWVWGALAGSLFVLMLANGSRNALLSLLCAMLVMLLLQSPRKVAIACLSLLLSAAVLSQLFPEYWTRSTGVLSYRDILWAAVFRHLPEHIWFGAGSTYFREVIALELSEKHIIAHNAYLDFLLAYGVTGMLFMLSTGIALARWAQPMLNSGANIWLYGSFGFLSIFGLFDRGHLDTLMLATMLMAPLLVTTIIGVIARSHQKEGNT